MAQFDIITAAANAYRICWEERRYIARLAVFPLLIKLVCFTFAASFAKGDGMMLRFSLYMLPAYFAEGWMLAHFTRLLVLNHRWPFLPSGDRNSDMAALSERARGVLAGMIVFVLINLGLGLFNSVVAHYLGSLPEDMTENPENLPPGITVVTLALLVGTLWGFRMLWLYIPFSLNMRGRDYLRSLKGFMASVHLIGIWLLCSIPFFLVMRMFSGAIITAIGEGSSAFPLFVLTAIVDTFKNLLTTAGITFALMQLFGGARGGR